jgi:autotransporter-associated beta strand protein
MGRRCDGQVARALTVDHGGNAASSAVAAMLLATFLGATAVAAEIEKANNPDLLSDGSSWTGGVAPTGADVAVWNATAPAAAAWNLGADLAWGGIRVTDPGGLVVIGNTVDEFTLSLADASIDLSTATQNLVINSNLAVSGAQAWQVADGRTLQLQTINTDRTLTGSGTITLSNASGSGTATFDFRPGSRGSIGFEPQAGFSGYTGDWEIESGTVVKTLRNGINAWGSGTISLAGGTVGQQQNFNGAWTNVIELVAGTDSVIDDFNNSGDRALQLNGVIQGSGNLTFQETNPNVTMTKDTCYVLAADNTMSGTVTVAEGTFLRVGGQGGDTNQLVGGVPIAGALGTLGTAAVTVDGGLAFTRVDTIEVANPISGSGTVYVGSGSGTLADTAFQDVTLSAVNTYEGGTQLLAGTLRINGLSSIGSGPVTIRGGSTLYYNAAGAAETNRDLLIDSGGATTIVMTDPTADLVWNDTATKNQDLIKDGPGSLTLGGPITGAASVTVNAGTLALGSTASSYTGGTFVNAGKLAFASVGTGSLVVNSGGLQWWPGSGQDISSQLTIGEGFNLELDTNGNDVAFAEPIGSFSSSGLTKSGSGTLTLNGFNSYTGATEITGGTLALATGASLQSPTVTVGDGGALGGGGTAPAVTVLAGGGLVPGSDGAGSLSVSSLTFGSTAGIRRPSRSQRAHPAASARRCRFSAILSPTEGPTRSPSTSAAGWPRSAAAPTP